MKSFSILRTNVGLTTNVKITIDSEYNLSLNSIDSNFSLSSDKFKKYKFSKNDFYDEVIKDFYKNIPTDISFDIKYDNDNDIMYDDFSNQYDKLYNYGAKNIIENKNYTEEYEYFAPLYIMPNKIPSNFIIFRVDGPGMENINKENVNEKIFNRFKTVKVFDLGLNTRLGEWLEKNFISNPYFPHTPLEIDFRNLEFSKWNGIDYINGGYTSKSSFLEEIFENENEIYELEKFIFDNYKNNKVIFPNILNLNFLFNDTPSTPDIKRKWSLNRYFGFYLNEMNKVETLSPYKPYKLREDVVILEGNILKSESNENPFLEDWTEEKPFYVEYKGNYFLVEKVFKNEGEGIGQVQDDGFINEEYKIISSTSYKIISDIDLKSKEEYLNNNYGYIDENNFLRKENGSFFEIDGFDKASVWLIKIDNIYHNIIKQDSKLIINSDYSFIFNNYSYSYKIRNDVKTFNFKVDFENEPILFNIYKLNFTDVKDFDTKIIDTEYSKYEYEKEFELTETDEPKMYFENPLSKTIPKQIDDYVLNSKVVNIPVSSEYTANYETFKVEDGNLSDIWRINPLYCRWGFQGSIGNQNQPYLLNNSLLFEDYNKCANPFEVNPVRTERNLDYFFTINSSSSSYINHSLHIEKYDDNGLNINFNFDELKYLNVISLGFSSIFFQPYKGDYFEYIFNGPVYFDDLKIKKNVRKYSYFNKGDSSIPNITSFKGLEFKIYNVNSVSLDSNGNIKNINTTNINEFENYKFSIIVTENKPKEISWTIIDPWQMNKKYDKGEIVVFDDILYRSLQNNNIINKPKSKKSNIEFKTAPYNISSWEIFDSKILWVPLKTYRLNNIVYNSSNYFYCKNANGSIDFWNPYKEYSDGEIVLYKNKYYKSLVDNNKLPPNSSISKTKSRSFVSNSLEFNKNNWKEENVVNEEEKKWKKVEIWNPSKIYQNNYFVVHENILYESADKFIEIGDEPGVSISWKRLYSMEPDNEYIYKPNDNQLIFMNSAYYLNDYNTNKKLDNGINIYINKKWKNVLIRIYVNDNTLKNLRNTNRDELYSDIYKKLTAYNFVRCINDISNKYEFSNYLNYIIIDESGEVKTYNYLSNIKKLPYIISCETPEDLKVKSDSLKKEISEFPKIEPNIRLNNGKINNKSQLNWYNNIPLSYSINGNKEIFKEFKNYSSNKNIEYLQIQRFNGYYMPIFYDIDLFNNDINIFDKKEENNYIFDTELTDFGIVKEIKMNKINREGSILMLKESTTEKSIYPMVNEYGYTYKDFMIFKSTWDKEYYTETVKNKERFITKNKKNIDVPSSIGQPSLLKNK